MNKIIIIGAGGHSKVIQDIILATNKYKIHAILDDSFTQTETHNDIIYSTTAYIKEIKLECYSFVMAIGNNQVRKKLVDRFKIPEANLPVLIHPSAIISGSSKIKFGTVVMPNAVINANSSIGSHSIINTGAIVEHDNFLGDFVHLSPGSVLAGGVEVSAGTHLGSGSVVIPGKKVGSWSTIGAGAVVTGDLPDYVTAVGVPAKIIKE